LWLQLERAGLPLANGYGAPVPNTPVEKYPMLDETEFSIPPNAPDPPPVALLDVPGARPIVRAEATGQPIVVAGDGTGLVDMAAAGLLNDDTAPILYSASLDGAALQSTLADGAHLVVTDTNRRQGLRWSSVRENTGYTEQAGEVPLKTDPADNRLDVFPGSTDDDRTVAQQRGVVSVQATGYGNPVSYSPEERPAMALDGDPQTAWRVGAFSPVKGEKLVVALADPVQPGYLTLVQPLNGNRNRYLTKVRLTFDGKRTLDVPLTEASRSAAGQRVDIGDRRFSKLQIEVLQDNIGKLPSYSGLSGVGFAEVGIPGVNVDEYIRLPVDLLARAGPAAATEPLTLVMTRLRTSQLEETRSDPETHLARTVELPASRSFALGGQVRINGNSPDQVIDALLGQPDARAGGVTATSTARLLGEPQARASSAIDGDPATAWTTPIDAVIGQTATFTTGTPFTVQHLDLQLVADGRHSVPTRLTFTMNGRETSTVDIRPVTDGTDRQHTVTVPVTLPVPLTGTALAVRIDAVREVTSTDYLSERPAVMPASIAELGIAGLHTAPLKPTIDTGCRDDLLTIDGTAVPVRVTGTAAAALNRDALTLQGCPGPLTLSAGTHDIRSAIGRDGGLDLDRLVLDAAATTPAPARPAAPSVQVLKQGTDTYTVRVSPSASPTWLVLGQSLNAGWHAVAEGRDLGKPQLIDGYANGWQIDPSVSPVDVKLYWAPQRGVWAGLGVSLLGFVLCVFLALSPRTVDTEVVVRSPYASAPAVSSPVLTPVSVRDRRLWVVLPALAALGVGWLLAGPLPGVLAGAVLAARLGRPAWRRFLIAAPAACMGITVAYIIAKTVRYPIPAGLAWPTSFDAVHPFAFAAVTTAAALVVGDVIVSRLRWRDVGGQVVRAEPPREVARVG
jgi:hypothetical protein